MQPEGKLGSLVYLEVGELTCLTERKGSFGELAGEKAEK